MKVICERSSLSFEIDSKRFKQHPKISDWLQTANKEGWYSAGVEAIEFGRKQGLKTIDEFTELINLAKANAKVNQETRSRLWAERKAQLKEQHRSREILAKTLSKNGYRWENNQILDIAQGETGDYVRELISPDGKVVLLKEAIAQIYESGQVMSTSGHFVQAGTTQNIIKISL